MIAPTQRRLVWVTPADPLPDPSEAWTEPNGLLAAGSDLGPHRLLQAYSRGIFPWYSAGQPVLWWSPDPRMVLYLDEFKLSRSLRQKLRRERRTGRWRVSLDRSFERVMRECAQPRPDQDGTWITDEVVAAYCGLHRAGLAHSVELWADDVLVGGLYGVSIGAMFFGESMFAREADASKAALFALVTRLRGLGFRVIDCQQNTRHLASLGAREISRAAFLSELAASIRQPAPDWRSLSIELPDA
ncbi:MAG: leucyl/phenylalanyl-tRNA--protein transferase [Burkholderiales bacterium]|nr:leucyl/phenylalanyl-tRNA--protein transferase [Burkholderiales bacterium]